MNDEFSDNYKGAKASMDKVNSSFKNIFKKYYISNFVNKLNDLKQHLKIIYNNRLKSFKDKSIKLNNLELSIFIFNMILIELGIFMILIWLSVSDKNCCKLKCYIKLIIYII